MLLDLGCRHVILGRSERRHILGESEAIVNRKVRCALGVGLRVVLCLGETFAERQAGRTMQELHSSRAAWQA
jgi:triosephosphate isomerase